MTRRMKTTDGTYSATHSYYRFGGGGSGLNGCGNVGDDLGVCRGRCDGGCIIIVVMLGI